jgi:hypothetical protein
MHKCVLYRQTRRKNSMFSSMERDFLCVCTPETFVSARVSTFSGFSAAAPVGLRCVEPRLFWPPIRGIKCLPLPTWFIIPSIMFGRLSRTLTTAALKLWIQSRVRVDRMNSPKMTRHLLPKPPSVRRIFWAVPLSDGRWKNCGSIFLPKRSSRRSALKHFGGFCMRKRSNFDARKHGKSATTRSLTLKKTDSPVRKPARGQWSHDFIRRVWPSGNSAATRAGLVRNRPSEAVAGHVYPTPRGAALACLLRCPQEKAVGLYAASQTASGIPGCIEAFTEEVSQRATHSSDFGQLFAAPQRESAAVLQQEQYSFDLDANQCIMAQSYRMSVHPCQGIRHSWNQLSKSSGTQNFLE